MRPTIKRMSALFKNRSFSCVIRTILCAALIVALSISLIPVSVGAEEPDAEKMYTETVTYINPIYADIISEEDIVQPQAEMTLFDAAAEYTDSLEEAGNILRDGFISREESIQVNLSLTSGDFTGMDHEDARIAVLSEAMKETDDPSAGDYIRYQYGYLQTSVSYSASNCQITYYPSYYTTAEQEAAVTAEVANVLGTMELDDKAEDHKAAKIYEYITSHVVYDYDNLNDSSYKLKYTAYAALINGTSVCQGYANLFYRLCREAGLSARIISGTGAGGNHAWNIVRIENLYYNVDSTWDAGRSPSEYNYFLKCDENFVNHTRGQFASDTDYTSAEFYEAYPMSSIDYRYPESAKVQVSSVSLTTDSQYILSGESCEITASVSPADAFDRTVSWDFPEYTIGFNYSLSGNKCILTPNGDEGYIVVNISSANDIHIASLTIFVSAVPHVHVEEGLPAVPATCTEPGLTEGKICADCGAILVEQEELPALGHSYDENGVCRICGSHMVTGWYEMDGWRYYYNEDGKAANGLTPVDGYTYYFENGRMIADTDRWIYDKDSGKEHKYYFDENGHMVTGWYEMDGNRYYYNEDGKAANGFTPVDGYTYYFENGRMNADTDIWIYDEDSGKEYKYDFDENGHMVTGWYIGLYGNLHYCNQDGRAAIGLTNIDGNLYYFYYPNGAMAYDQTIKDSESGNLLVIGSDGIVIEIVEIHDGWVQIGSKLYYYENGEAVQGFKEIDGYTYYFYWDGIKTGFNSIGNDLYCFDESGHMLTGWQKEGSTWYYFTSSGKAATGLTTIDGNLYYFNSKMHDMAKSTTIYISDSKTLIHVGNDGIVTETVELSDGWGHIGNEWYYSKDGNIVKNRWERIDGYWYYFGYYGRMYASRTIEIKDEDSGRNYLYSFDENGHMITGWNELGPLGWYYYYEDRSVANGLTVINGKQYYFDESGHMLIGWQQVSGVWYYFTSSGAMVTGWQQVGGTWYYFKDSGAMATGWQKVGSTWYYFKDSGAMVTGWQKVGGTWYYFKDSGAMVTGWQSVGGTWYYFKSSGAMAANEWCDGYWLNADGSWTYQPKGSWKQDSTGWWFGDTSGWYAKNSTVKIDNVNYKFNASGYWVK